MNKRQRKKQYKKYKNLKIIVNRQTELFLVDPDRITIIEFLPDNLSQMAHSIMYNAL